jgi:acyl-ACP thioesterase
MPETRHVEEFPIRSYECDPYGRLLPRTLCLLLQETAAAHAAELGVSVESLLERGIAWVLSQLRLEMAQWPRAGATLHVETWPHAATGTRIERRFEILDPDGNTLGTASTLWLVMDLERRRPVRLPEDVTATFETLVSPDRPMKLVPIPVLEHPEMEQTLTVAYGDLDMVHHANNAAFVEWMVECVAGSLWSSHDPAEVEVHYLAECRLGDTILSRCGPLQPGDRSRALHRLVRAADGVDAARARTVWRPIDGSTAE